MPTFATLGFVVGIFLVREARILEVSRTAFGTRGNPNRIMLRSAMDDLVVSRHEGTVQKIINGCIEDLIRA